MPPALTSMTAEKRSETIDASVESSASGRIITRVGIGIIRHEGKVVVGVRASDATLGGFAEFPGGKCELGEPVVETIRRECLEETGLVVDVEDAPLVVTRHDYAHGKLELHFHLCTLQSDGSAELAGSFRWVEKWELAALKFPPANTEALELLSELPDA